MEGEPKGQDELQKSGRSSAEPEEKPPVAKTFTQEQVDKLLGEVQGKKDKTIASLTKERDTLKSQLEEVTTQAQQATELRKELEKDLDAAVSDNSDQSEILKLKRELRTAVVAEKDAIRKKEKELIDQKESHDKEWESRQSEITLARSENLAIIAWDIAEEYQGGNAEVLKGLCEDAGQLTEEFARKSAARLWPKKTEIPNPLTEGKPDPGGTSGGADEYKIAREEFIKDNFNPEKRNRWLIAKAAKEGGKR